MSGCVRIKLKRDLVRLICGS